MNDTIAAISTPPGEGAIALIRVSGDGALQVASRIYHGKVKPEDFQSHQQHLGEIAAGQKVIDQVLMTIHRAPSTYTGEDMVEVSCHGGTLVTARVLEACLQAGARPARPGEFTERAFLNGKLDLTQAEAVIDLIRAKTDLALRSATEQLEGKLGHRIKAIRDGLIALTANAEAAIDFSEEGIAPDEGEAMLARLEMILSQIAALLATAEQGRIWREGVRVVIYGAPNAGKSSLLNHLLGYDRAIVSETPGTTRDTIEEVINLRGVPIRLLDTAGLRHSTGQVERAGIERTEKSLQTADVLLHIADRNAARPADFGERAANGSEMILLNKSDLPEHPDWEAVAALRLSCMTGHGIDQLEEALLARIQSGHLQPESAVAINARHRDCLRRAFASCEAAKKAMAAGHSLEYVAVDLQQALQAVGEILGAVDVEQILDSVFGQFCIGK